MLIYIYVNTRETTFYDAIEVAMYMCVYMYIYSCIYISIYMHISVDTSIYIYICMCIYIWWCIYIYIYISKCYRYEVLNLQASPEVKYKRRPSSRTEHLFDLQAIALVNLRAFEFTGEDCKFEDYSRALVNLRARVLWVVGGLIPILEHPHPIRTRRICAGAGDRNIQTPGLKFRRQPLGHAPARGMVGRGYLDMRGCCQRGVRWLITWGMGP